LRAVLVRAGDGLDEGIVNVIPLTACLSDPTCLVVVGDVVAKGAVDGGVDETPWHAGLPELTVALTDAVFEEVVGVQHVRVIYHQHV
jgi:hypothetical protein